LIGAFVGRQGGPTLIAVGSLHGNEPAGSLALSRIAERLPHLEEKLAGRVYLITGNTRAIARRKRFLSEDLNRQWTSENLSRVGSEELYMTPEGTELTELDQILDSILITAMDEVFVLDLHSTSADGMPFATVGDTLRNRQFAQKFPVTILLGIEEQLEGTMLEYLNTAGAVTLGFEGGQHVSQQTIRNHEALVWLALVNAGILDKQDAPDLAEMRKRLSGDEDESARVFEIRYRHAVTADDEFEMLRGFNNFDKVRSGQMLGSDRRGRVTACESGILLMPLYQKQGEDGFFIGREISPFWLKISEILRRLGVQNYIHLLPGVRRHDRDPQTRHLDLLV